MTKIQKIIANPLLPIAKVWESCFKFMRSDKIFIEVSFFLRLHQFVSWDNPKTFNQKMQWLKLHNNTPLHTKLVDKYAVREWVKTKIGEEYLIPLLGVWSSFDDIDFESLPNQFVLKTTHDSGSVLICKDKRFFDYSSAKNKLCACLRRNYYWVGREYPYKNVIPRIICEKYMEEDGGQGLVDYKFFCFNGQPQILFYASERFNDKHEPPKFDYYDMELKKLPIQSKGHQNSSNTLTPFPQFDEMKRLAAVMAEGFPFVRTDFYLINGRIFFGEMTFHHDGGLVPFIPREWDRILGDRINLPTDKNR